LDYGGMKRTISESMRYDEIDTEGVTLILRLPSDNNNNDDTVAPALTALDLGKNDSEEIFQTDIVEIEVDETQNSSVSTLDGDVSEDLMELADMMSSGEFNNSQHLSDGIDQVSRLKQLDATVDSTPPSEQMLRRPLTDPIAMFNGGREDEEMKEVTMACKQQQDETINLQKFMQRGCLVIDLETGKTIFCCVSNNNIGKLLLFDGHCSSIDLSCVKECVSLQGLKSGFSIVLECGESMELLARSEYDAMAVMQSISHVIVDSASLYDQGITDSWREKISSKAMFPALSLIDELDKVCLVWDGVIRSSLPLLAQNHVNDMITNARSRINQGEELYDCQAVVEGLLLLLESLKNCN